MAQYVLVIAALCVTASAAPPVPSRPYAHHAPAQLHQLNPLDYYLENPEVAGYFSQVQQKQDSAGNNANAAPSRLETLEPDSEVELLPGAQPPQQPPQQTPVSPNLPGLLPGQRVFIVHMPVPGYRPGTIGGYQPVYVVAAGPQGNTGFPGNGYQNTVFLDPSGQVVQPLVGYPQAPPQANPGLVLRAPLTLNRPSELVYQDPTTAYQPAPAHRVPDAHRSAVRLSQSVGLQSRPVIPASGHRSENVATPAEPKQLAQMNASVESNEAEEVPRRNARPAPTHAQIRQP